ncbi:MAG: ferrochelatase [Acidimicrobiales bacterium]
MTGAGPYDAVLVLSFGGPDGPDDVIPFLENVTRGRGIPRERLAEVGAHYELFGGVSPINAANRALIDALQAELREAGPDLPVYWGNRNWHPFLADTLEAMAADGVRRAVCFVTSAFSSYSACRQYLDDIEAARATVGPGAPEIDKLRPFFDHPGFIGPMVKNVTAALAALPSPVVAGAPLVFTAHSRPAAQAARCDYEAQLGEAARLVAEAVGGDHPWALVFQSRSGPPGQPWLGPDVGDHLAMLAAAGDKAAVIVPVGFVADHVEVIYDLDIQAAARADELGLTITRAATVGTAPPFVAMIRELIAERTDGAPRRALSPLPPRPLSCAEGCCPAPPPRPSRPA